MYNENFMCKINSVLAVLIFLIASVSVSAGSQSPSIKAALIYNGLVKVKVDAESGTFDIIDLRHNRTIISNSKIGFMTAPYVDLEDVSEYVFETEKASSRYTVEKFTSVTRKGSLETAFDESYSISVTG